MEQATSIPRDLTEVERDQKFTQSILPVLEQAVTSVVEKAFQNTIEQTIKKTIEDQIQKAAQNWIENAMKSAINNGVQDTIKHAIQLSVESGARAVVLEAAEASERHLRDELNSNFHDIREDFRKLKTAIASHEETMERNLISVDDAVQTVSETAEALEQRALEITEAFDKGIDRIMDDRKDVEESVIDAINEIDVTCSGPRKLDRFVANLDDTETHIVRTILRSSEKMQQTIKELSVQCRAVAIQALAQRKKKANAKAKDLQMARLASKKRMMQGLPIGKNGKASKHGTLSKTKAVRVAQEAVKEWVPPSTLMALGQRFAGHTHDIVVIII